MFRFVEYASVENSSEDRQLQPSLTASHITFVNENDADIESNSPSNNRPHGRNDYQQSSQHFPSQMSNSVPTSCPVGSGSPLSPLKSEYEASLFKYFMTSLSPWFDYCDPSRHFYTYIASSASSNPILLYAVLTVAARHQRSHSERERLLADEYQQYCLESLISALDNSEKTLDESLFASAVILRLSEEMTEPSPREIVDSHTLSAHILVRIKEGNICTSSFTDAALIVVLRQEIFVANLTQRPVGSFTDHCNIDTSLGPTSEAMWTYRIIAHAAKITDFVYGDVMFRTKDRWNDLMRYVQDWEDSRPNAFMPIYSEAENPPSSCFPKIWYCNDCHVAARLYSELCRILLLASDPDASALRIGRFRRMQDNDDKIRECVRVICGVALTNPEFHTTRSTAGLAIGLCGELFHDPRETKVLLELLSAAEFHLGWPCLKLKEDLRRFWGLPVVEP
ncbi:hypothetical protein BDV35DRAFT_271374 [Aspergillus flavus]|uniref:ARCA protein n=3 Tax=Aspergillus subgen. Circumdati TaxID=2720871 RepID=A0A1S9E129_ASPOZ|nr:hypothetical protein Ao3042_04650 [Aspergillus oryzae 3.042]KAB8245045.1 hypothetical protein BDV35DRAFT_271374 [Aspergillus flavus]KDE77675.1 hypothetical protein AO1008_03328 [Aspergillus oryzae 100-8]OOO15011.1 Protein of unknown function DUF3468 [Aspergillus oryzae]|eukprot:EIT79026.1 hypothetical protein Ao3042_04650 [Aspergillus oryzae 3.042]